MNISPNVYSKRETPVATPMGNLASQVANDQISKFQDTLRPWFLVPTGTAVLVLVAASVALAVMRRRIDDPEKKRKPSSGAAVIVSVVSICVSILVMIVMSIILAIRHPRATAEQMATRSFVSLFK